MEITFLFAEKVVEILKMAIFYVWSNHWRGENEINT